MSLRVGVVQLAAGLDKAANREQVCRAVEGAADAGAELVVVPEVSMLDYGPADLNLAPVAESLDGPFVSSLADVASRCGVTVLAGMFEYADDRHVFNTVVALDGSGALLGRYRKQHLFDALGWVESDRLAPGDPDDRLVFPLGGMTVGVMTCYDVRFPELARALTDDGADLMVVPSAWVGGPGKLEQWRALTTARAIENVCYVAGAVQPPPTYTGGSIVVDPWGSVLASLDADPGFAVAEVSEARVRECREKMPSLANRRWRVEPNVT